jgi:hypothetical protein
MAGVVAIAVPVATASAATSGPFTAPDVGQLIKPYRDNANANVNAAFDTYQKGAQIVVNGWTDGANTLANDWLQGLQGLQDASNNWRSATQTYLQNVQSARDAYVQNATHAGPLLVPNG